MLGLAHQNGKFLHRDGVLTCECCNVVKQCNELVFNQQWIRPNGDPAANPQPSAFLEGDCGLTWTNSELPFDNFVGSPQSIWFLQLENGDRVTFRISCNNGEMFANLRLSRAGDPIVYESEDEVFNHVEILENGEFKLWVTAPLYLDSGTYVCDVEIRINYP